MKRWYVLQCIDCKASTADEPVVYAEHRVSVVGGVIDAFEQAKADGYWPLYVLASDWEQIDLGVWQSQPPDNASCAAPVATWRGDGTSI